MLYEVITGGWVVSSASEKQEEAEVFMNYTSSPEVQAKLSRNVGTAPVAQGSPCPIAPPVKPSTVCGGQCSESDVV